MLNIYWCVGQSSEDEVILQEVLYDIVMMWGNSFLEPPRGMQLTGNHLKSVILTWLFVADTVIRCVW